METWWRPINSPSLFQCSRSIAAFPDILRFLFLPRATVPESPLSHSLFFPAVISSSSLPLSQLILVAIPSLPSNNFVVLPPQNLSRFPCPVLPSSSSFLSLARSSSACHPLLFCCRHSRPPSRLTLTGALVHMRCDSSFDALKLKSSSDSIYREKQRFPVTIAALYD